MLRKATRLFSSSPGRQRPEDEGAVPAVGVLLQLGQGGVRELDLGVVELVLGVDVVADVGDENMVSSCVLRPFTSTNTASAASKLLCGLRRAAAWAETALPPRCRGRLGHSGNLSMLQIYLLIFVPVFEGRFRRSHSARPPPPSPGAEVAAYERAGDDDDRDYGGDDVGLPVAVVVDAAVGAFLAEVQGQDEDPVRPGGAEAFANVGEGAGLFSFGSPQAATMLS